MRFVIIWVLLLTGLQAAQEIVFREYSQGTSIRLVAPIESLPRGGFYPVRVEMENRASEAISWSIEVEAEQYADYRFSRNGDSPKIETRFGVSCPSGEKKVTELLIPVHRESAMGSEGAVDQQLGLIVRRVDSPEQFERGTVSSSEYSNFQKVVLSQKLKGEFHRAFVNAWEIYRPGSKHSFPGRSGRHTQPHSYFFDADLLPEDWRGYAGYDAFVFGREDYLEISPGVKAALDQWVQAGGHLLVVNQGIGVPIPGFLKEITYEGMGSRQILACGEAYVQSDGEALIAALDHEAPERVINRKNYQSTRGSWGLMEELGERSLQTGLILIALIVFAIIVGPVNLFVWADKTRRHRLFFTTPLISLVTSLILIAFIVLRDGFGGEGVRAVAIDVGDAGGNSAAIVQEQFSRSGILFSSSFTLDDNSVIQAMPAPVTEYNLADSKSARGLVSYDAKLAEGGWEFSGDWFESRTEQVQILRSVIPSRERLELIPSAGGGPRLVSSFSYPLEKICYRDEDGKMWYVDGIAPGETVAMASSRLNKQELAVGSLIARFQPGQQHRLREMIQRPGSFSAQAVGAPAIATHDAIDWQETPALITGLLK